MKEHEGMRINTSERIPQTHDARRFELPEARRKGHKDGQSLRHLVEGTKHLYKDAERILLDS